MIRQTGGVADPTVEAWMTPRPIVIVRGQDVGAAARLLRACHIRHLPVMDGDTLVGILSLRDVLTVPPDAAVADVMTAPPETAAPETPLGRACERMLAGRLSALPVVDARGRLIGIFTATDGLRFATAALDEDWRTLHRAPTVAQLMTPRPLVTVEPNEPLAAAWERMAEADVRHLPVVRGEATLGLISDRDVLQASASWLDALAAGAERPRLRVADAMGDRTSTIDAERPAPEAARTLSRRRTGALLVLRGPRLVGLLTVSDFLYWIHARI